MEVCTNLFSGGYSENCQLRVYCEPRRGSLMSIHVCSARREKVPPLVLCTAFDMGMNQIDTTHAILPDVIGEKLFFFSNINIFHNGVLLASTFLFTVNYCKTLYMTLYIRKPLGRCVGKAHGCVVNLSIRLCHLLMLANDTSAFFQLFRSFICLLC